jgi:hypothetical protein
VKVQDSTFRQAVVITPASQNSASSGSGGFAEIGNSLTAELPGLAPAPGSAPPTTPGQSPGGAQGNTPYLPPGQPVQIQVVFKK